MGKTRGVQETTPELRNRMVGMYEAGLGLREIAAAINCSQRTVKRWLNRFDREGNVETRERCGRKRATTKEEDEAIIRLATQTPITAAKAVLPVLRLNCSVDTVRERLHKAGIHNWSPSRKHIQKIPIAVSDSVGIQQAVWRPTGTHLGKKKLSKEENKTKISNHQSKKKIAAQKIKSKQICNSDGEPNNDTSQQTENRQNFSFSPLVQNEQRQSQINEMQPMLLPPPPLQPIPPPSLLQHAVISSNQNQYTHPLNLLHPQSHYHHPNLNISQNWPLDLVQNTQHFAQNLENSTNSEQHPSVSLQNQHHLQSHHSMQLSQNVENQMHSSLQPLHNINVQKDDHHLQPHQDLSELSQEKLNDSQDIIINVCSEVCSNSNNSSNENSQSSSAGDETSNCNINKKKKSVRSKKKKGGKIKGTLETSVELRNRMIGMSEAGLSTLSIALAINRSERTVKRWLDRWRKEGNVQTKERKGRRRITTKEEDDAIIAMATQQPLTAAKHVAPALGLKCSVDTIRERLHKAGIHSWKLGKKQGEGNAVHTVHLWQPSGNRSSKVKTNGNKKKKYLNKKRTQKNNINFKKSHEKQSKKRPFKPSVSTASVMPEEPNIHFQTQSQSSAIIQTAHELSGSTSIMPIQHVQQDAQISPVCSQISTTQSLQPLTPVIAQRSDCRLTLSAVVPPMHNHVSTAVPSYPSCMMGSSAHTGHLEQSDPMNYEPYIWSF